jgi:hypothetical protein
VWPTDAHAVCYIAAAADAYQPRITKEGIADWPGRIFCHVLMADVDNDNHAAWTEDTLAAAVEQHRTLPILQTVGWYTTAHGRRLVQPLAVPVAVPDVEDVLRRWYADLEAAGVAVDRACLDWTRHFRLPNVVRREARDRRAKRK